MTQARTQKLPIPNATGSLDNQAIDWVIYLHSGQAGEEGKQAFSQWLSLSKTHVKAYEKAEQWWRDMGYTEGMETASDPAVSNITPLHPRQVSTDEPSASGGARHLPAFIGIAAALALFAVGWQVFFAEKGAAPGNDIYESSLGEVKTIALSDGTRLVLGAASSVQASYTANERHVELLEGRAWLDIEPDSMRPFTLKVGRADIQVLGTAFDVQKRDSDIRLAVTAGKVALVSNGNTEQVVLSAGEQAIVAGHGTLPALSSFDVNEVQAWRQGRLEYADARLADVVAEVNRYRTAKIVLADEELQDIRITMGVASNQTDRLLSALKVTAPVRIEALEAGIMVYAAEKP